MVRAAIFLSGLPVPMGVLLSRASMAMQFLLSPFSPGLFRLEPQKSPRGISRSIGTALLVRKLSPLKVS